MKSQAKLFFLFIILSLFQKGTLTAQISVGQFFKKAQSDFEVSVFDEQINYLNKKPYQLSPLQKMEFRTESNQLDRNRQDYALRFNPANPWEIKNTNKYFEGYKSSLVLEKQLALKKALDLRYTFVIEYVFFKEIKTIKEQDKKLVEDQLSIMEAQQFSEYFKAEDYIDLKLNHIDRITELEESEYDLYKQLQQLSIYYSGAIVDSLNWSSQNIISIERVEEVVDSLENLSLTFSSLNYRESKIELANAEYNLEKSNFNIGFMQAQYQHFRIAQDRSPWSISMGVTIPITNPNKGDMTKSKMDLIEAEYQLNEAKAEMVTDKSVAANQLKNLIQRYKELILKIETLQSNSLAGTLNILKDNNPAPLIRFKTNLLKLKTIEAKLKLDIYLSYSSYLSVTDQLQQTPIINFLSNELSRVDL